MSLSDALSDSAEAIIRYLTKEGNYSDADRERCWKLIDEMDAIRWQPGYDLMPGATEEQQRQAVARTKEMRRVQRLKAEIGVAVDD
jgi:flagellar biosynthesis component FlhA